MRERTKSAIKVLWIAAAAVITTAGCSLEGGTEEMLPGRADTSYMAVAYTDIEEEEQEQVWDTNLDAGRLGHVPSQVLFELRIGTAGSAVGFRIRQSRAGEAGHVRTTSRKARQSECLSFEIGNLDSRHGGPLCFDLSLAGQVTAN